MNFPDAVRRSRGSRRCPQRRSERSERNDQARWVERCGGFAIERHSGRCYGLRGWGQPRLPRVARRNAVERFRVRTPSRPPGGRSCLRAKRGWPSVSDRRGRGICANEKAGRKFDSVARRSTATNCSRISILLIVPKLRLGMPMSAQLRWLCLASRTPKQQRRGDNLVTKQSLVTREKECAQ